MTITIEINERHADGTAGLRSPSGVALLICPPVNGEYWLWRVPVAKDQAIVAFRKFGTIGCGFQRETDWNTNLPLGESASKIYDHIEHNKGCRATRAKCIAAIEALQQYAAQADPDWAAAEARHRSRTP